MFFVVHKDKMYAYVVSILMVVLLFGIASRIGKEANLSMATSANSTKQLPIYCVETQEKKVALTLNCAWNDSDIDSILQTLKDKQVKLTFFMVGDWMEKYPEAVKKISEAGCEIR